jgi:hypothetical protein
LLVVVLLEVEWCRRLPEVLLPVVRALQDMLISECSLHSVVLAAERTGEPALAEQVVTAQSAVEEVVAAVELPAAEVVMAVLGRSGLLVGE